MSRKKVLVENIYLFKLALLYLSDIFIFHFILLSCWYSANATEFHNVLTRRSLLPQWIYFICNVDTQFYLYFTELPTLCISSNTVQLFNLFLFHSLSITHITCSPSVDCYMNSYYSWNEKTWLNYKKKTENQGPVT